MVSLSNHQSNGPRAGGLPAGGVVLSTLSLGHSAQDKPGHKKRKEYEMTTLTVDIGTLITRTPDVRGGNPRIVGTGVTVQRIVGWYKLGLSPEEIASRIGHLTLAQVHAALTYYHANRDEIEAAIKAEEIEADRLEERHYQAAAARP